MSHRQAVRPQPPTDSPTAPQRPGWVRLRTILGESVLPPESAAVVAKAVKKAVALGHVSPNARWQIIEMWAADYLAGVETDRQELIRAATEAANTSPDAR